jgi:hypothetical protein
LGGHAEHHAMHIESHDQKWNEASATDGAQTLDLKGSSSAPGSLVERREWTCPMHAAILRDVPGVCPLCGMALQAQAASAFGANTSKPSPAKDIGPARPPVRIPIWLGACLFGAIALYFLWDEHRVHILSALPYVLLLSCPLIHIFMHGGHGHNHHNPTHHDSARGDER